MNGRRFGRLARGSLVILCLLAVMALVPLAGCSYGSLGEAKAIEPSDTAREMTFETTAGPAAQARMDAMGNMDFRKVVKHAKDKVFPAVVYIKVIAESHESGKKISQEATGSGVIITAGGELLTNWHVVDKAVEVRCLLSDGRAYDAEVVGSDKDVDLALCRLKMKEGETVPFANLGQAKGLREGDFVMAMGAPWGLSRSVSIGIISCTRRYLPEHSEYSLWLQTDAAISPGNSGGPLVNTDGQIIGINTRGVMSGGDMGFAIPAETVTYVVDQFRRHGKVEWSWTGLQLQALRDFNKNIYFDANEGVIVASTDPESPAKRAGLQPRDRVVRIGATDVTATTEEDLPAVRKLLGELPIGKEVQITVMREGTAEPVAAALTPREKGKVEGEELDCPRWDLTVKEINQFDNPRLYYFRKQGVFIYGVKYPGNAANAGLNREDIVLKIDGNSVKTLDDVRTIHKDALAKVDQRPKLVFTILRNGLLQQIVLDFSRDYEKE